MVSTIKTALQVVDEICQVLAAVPAQVGLSGELRKVSRRTNSAKEDIVVSPVYLTSGQMQRGTFNVNIHVPNLENQASGNSMMVDSYQPNLERMEAIAQACISALNETYLFDCMVDLGNAGEPLRDGDNWVYNLSITYYSPRVNED